MEIPNNNINTDNPEFTMAGYVEEGSVKYLSIFDNYKNIPRVVGYFTDSQIEMETSKRVNNAYFPAPGLYNPSYKNFQKHNNVAFTMGHLLGHSHFKNIGKSDCGPDAMVNIVPSGFIAPMGKTDKAKEGKENDFVVVMKPDASIFGVLEEIVLDIQTKALNKDMEVLVLSGVSAEVFHDHNNKDAFKFPANVRPEVKKNEEEENVQDGAKSDEQKAKDFFSLKVSTEEACKLDPELCVNYSFNPNEKVSKVTPKHEGIHVPRQLWKAIFFREKNKGNEDEGDVKKKKSNPFHYVAFSCPNTGVYVLDNAEKLKTQQKNQKQKQKATQDAQNPSTDPNQPKKQNTTRNQKPSNKGNDTYNVKLRYVRDLMYWNQMEYICQWNTLQELSSLSGVYFPKISVHPSDNGYKNANAALSFLDMHERVNEIIKASKPRYRYNPSLDNGIHNKDYDLTSSIYVLKKLDESS